MADITVSTTQHGAWEVALTANVAQTIILTSSTTGPAIQSAKLRAHLAPTPVYWSVATRSVSVKDPNADQVCQGAWVDVSQLVNGDLTLTVICASNGTVSVSR